MSKGIKHKDIGQELTEAEWLAEDSHDLDSGTSFPVSPSEKDRFYRSDEHKWYIFNGADWKALGGVDISDADAAVGDVRTGKYFYSVEEPRKTGTIPEVAIVAGSEAIPAGIHTAQNLSDIDADLVVGNIKKDVTIFGKLGTHVGGPVSEDLVTAVPCVIETTTSNLYSQRQSYSVSTILATVTPTFAANSLAIGVASGYVCRSSGTWRLRLEMDGVVVAESANISDCDAGDYDCVYYIVIGSKALVGAKVCLARMYEATDGTFHALTNRYGDERVVGGIAVGSVKL